MSAGGTGLQQTDPDDPPPKSRPVSRLEPVELQQTDPDDPPPKSRPVSKLAQAGKAPRKKAVRHHRPAEKPAKRRAGSRRR